MTTPNDVNSGKVPWMGHNLDYTDFLGGNIVDNEASPFDTPPKNDKDYAIYRQFHEEQATQLCRGEGRFYLSCKCWEVLANGKARQLPFPKNGHKGAPIAISCPHVIVHDPVHPEDVWFTPFKRYEKLGYYLCKTCYSLLERKRINIGTGTLIVCSACIEEQVLSMMTVDPTKYHDLRLVK